MHLALHSLSLALLAEGPFALPRETGMNVLGRFGVTVRTTCRVVADSHAPSAPVITHGPCNDLSIQNCLTLVDRLCHNYQS
jgi:hypothetical protein